MNIFVLSTDPVVAAQEQCDRHVTKMILESIEMLCLPFDPKDAPYSGQSHRNHPCSLWARRCEENFEWLLDHTFALLEEYTFRYGKIHAWSWMADWLADSYGYLGLPKNGKITPFHQAMPDELRESDERVVEAYRAFYFDDKTEFAYWRKTRPAPQWWWNGAPPWWIEREQSKLR